MLEINHITKKFRNVIALNDVTCSIAPGTVTGILGQNGAGKTTLLKIIGGLFQSDCGQVLYQGQKLRQADIGILLGGDVGLYPRLTARENILYFADLHGLDRRAAEERMLKLAEEFAMTNYLDRNADTLSRGTRQKVSIIRAVIHNPAVILFDEPETGLDFDAAKAIVSFLNLCAAEGKTVIYSSHTIGNILAACYDAYILHHGRIIKHCNVDEIQCENTYAEAQDTIFRLVMNIDDKGKEDISLHE